MSDPTRLKGTWYKAPGSDEWQRHVSNEERKALLRRARSLLARADRRLSSLGRLNRQKEGDLLAFERDMAAALGAWNRWVEASAKQFVLKSQGVVEDAWEAVKRTLKISDDDE
jgi:hypothetical protein